MKNHTSLMEQVRSGYVYFDGGMGTLLQEQGLAAGELPERWNLSHPEIIAGIHRSYLEAGCHILKANTFGANALKYEEEELSAVITAAIDLARGVIRDVCGGDSSASAVGSAPADGTSACEGSNAGKSVCEDATAAATPQPQAYVALDVGPTGKLLQPLGDLAFEDAVELFARTIRLGAAAGADLILIETMNDSYEMKAAVLAAKENCDLPVFATCAYDESGKLMTGASPAAMVALLEGLRVDALGVNCSLGPLQMLPVVRELTAHASVPVIVNPNAGLPHVENGRTVYDVGPAEFADAMTQIAACGARILGGCCGTTPAHMHAMIGSTAQTDPVPLSDKNETLISSYTNAVRFGAKPILIGERINPTGKKRFQQALRERDMEYILAQGLSQQENGAHVLDVNVGLPEIDEEATMDEVVRTLQSVCDLPLQIDTTDVRAMETALRHYNGKPMVNSVNGKQEVMHEIFPLVRKYGGLVVGLLLDEDGIPETVEGRLAIARRIYDTAAEYGIPQKDIILDALTMTVSTDDRAGMVTLETVRRITEEYHGLTSLGVSNISFGLPERGSVNAAFFLMTMTAGLSAAIMNPASLPMREAYYSFCALHADDPQCMDYIGFATGSEMQERRALLSGGGNAGAGAGTGAAGANAAVGAAGGANSAAGSTVGSAGEGGAEDPLVHAIRKGLKEQAAALAGEALEAGTAPLALIDTKMIPALDEVGKGFEKKTVFLPQLLMSAEAAKAAFAVLRRFMEEHGTAGEKKGKVVIATVKGDIHDIGKNIVKALLENYDFDVIDLGKDVPPETVVEAVVREHAPLAGLSALMTTTVPAMEETIRQLRESAPWCKVVVGGAVMTQKYADMIGADHYARDAMETVRYAEEVMREAAESAAAQGCK
ncbi:MAG: homocysteine S-methyltransferase family protein [Eubacteriales bacterium]|nr:homocysteine S-methyltransferase family protein [Eubacteriales bacterium]